MRLSSCLGSVLAVTLFSPLYACNLFDTKCKQGTSCLRNSFAEGLGGTCSSDDDCKAGLSCLKQTCQGKHDTPRGEMCRITAECGDADYCGSKRLCAAAGAAVQDASCQTTGSCKSGLVCEAADLSQLGTVTLSGLADSGSHCKAAGKKEQGETCKLLSDCVAGLSCAVPPGSTKSEKRCIDPVPTPVELPVLPALWEGESCASVKASDPVQSFFEVPRTGKKPSEFYALPFPNDVRLKNGHLDLSNHPIPPSSFGLPYVERYIDVASTDLDGFSTNPVALFRFSHAYSFGSVGCKDPGPCSVRIVDITPSSPEYAQKASIEWKVTKGPLSNYICPHWLGIRRPVGSPLRPHTTYAAIITNDIVPEKGGSFARGADFDAMLASGAPSDPDLKAAHDAYAPLRAWISDKGENADSILSAAVFTTQDPEALLPKLRTKIQADAMPSVADLTRCDSASTKSPCEDSTGRGKCHAASPELIEIHGHIKLPIFQKGTPPYLNPGDGGGIELESGGTPVIQDHRDVCVAISVPAAPAPSSGYPVLVFAHGTGGSFSDEMGAGGFAEAAATASVPSVLIAIDMPEHGNRRGASTDSPEDLFYNFLNPRAARDNVLQGAADLMSVVRWAGQGGLSASESPTSKAVVFDGAHIALMGHSQGATHSSLMVGYEPGVSGVVLSGNGGHLSSSMLTKTSPVDIASVLPIGLLDPDNNGKLSGGGYNPGLAIIQTVFDRADPVNYAHRLYRDPTTEVPTGRHAFMTYGQGDTYATEDTQAAYARAGHLTVVGPVLKDISLTVGVAPLSENETVGATKRTVGMRQYAPKNGVDGHFVATDQGQDGRPDVERFLDQVLAGSAPAIGQ